MSCLGENTVTDLIDALLAPERRASVEDHTAHCEACRRLISELVRRTQGRSSQLALGSPGSPVEREVAPGTRVGRYEVREPLGRGATGAVFAAFDPELDRLVALKLMHPALAQRERVQREARALARLADPHVVAVYDAGALDGELFLAMELVDGTDLRSWMRGRPLRELVDAFVQAGRGLAAAHAAGLVHRDFKPDNVLIGRDGRVRIGDFGLAGGLDGATDLVGTPAYIAPEQLESGGSDAASDQFAFCVALYEALHGERPFVVNLATEVARGPARWATGLPRRLTTTLARGLELDPRRRFPGMEALVDALAPPRRSRRAIAIGAAAVVVASAATSAAIVASTGHTSTALCADSPAVFAATWNPIRAALVRTRFAATGAPFAEQAWSTVERAFAQFGARWAATRTEACEATRVHGVQSDLLLTLRTRCLDRALAEADELELPGDDDPKLTPGNDRRGAIGVVETVANVARLIIGNARGHIPSWAEGLWPRRWPRPVCVTKPHAYKRRGRPKITPRRRP
ncbi:MAG: serine/threonine-protein kinase, partial [Kofleriaceae bacterium]